MEIGASESPEPHPPPPPPPLPVAPLCDQPQGNTAPASQGAPHAFMGATSMPPAPLESLSGFYHDPYGSFTQYGVQQYPDFQVRKLLALGVCIDAKRAQTLDPKSCFRGGAFTNNPTRLLSLVGLRSDEVLLCTVCIELVTYIARGRINRVRLPILLVVS